MKRKKNISWHAATKRLDYLGLRKQICYIVETFKIISTLSYFN